MTIEFDDREVREALQKLQLGMTNLKPVMEEIGALLLAVTQLRFREQHGPDGRPWKPSHRAMGQGGNRSRKDGDRRGDTLRNTGRLHDSITYQADDRSVVIGTNVVYAAVMQFGAKKGEFGSAVANVREHKRMVHFTTKAGEKSKTRRTQVVSAHERRIPAIPWGDIEGRPFLGINDQDKADILEIISRHMGLGGR